MDGTKVASTQPQVSRVYSRKSTKYLPAPREERITDAQDSSGGSVGRCHERGFGRSVPTVVVAHCVNDPRAEVVHVEHDALGHRAVMRAGRSVEATLVAEAVARRKLRVARNAVVPRLWHCTWVGQGAMEVRREQQEEQHVEDRL